MMAIIALWTAGFLANLLFLRKFGKAIGLYVDEPEKEGLWINRNWSGNAEARIGWSLMWFVITPIFLSIYAFSIIKKKLAGLIQKG